MRLNPIRLIAMLVLGLLVASLAANAQRVEQVARIGRLTRPSVNPQRDQSLREAFLQGLREFGWVEGQNILIEAGRAEESLPDLAARLVQLPVDVLVTGGEAGTLAAIHATRTIPIVMAVSADPVGAGLVASLARPGGNVTGLSIMAPEGGGKRLELLKEAVPQASRVAVLWNAALRGKVLEWQDTQVAAKALGVTLHSVEVRGPDDFDSAFAAIARERPDALITMSDAFIITHQRRIVDFVAENRLPMISESKEFAVAGALMTYGASLPALVRRAAYYVDRILRGTKPADLPVEQPWKFELVLNLKTAQALGVTFPPTLLILADEVIR